MFVNGPHGAYPSCCTQEANPNPEFQLLKQSMLVSSVRNGYVKGWRKKDAATLYSGEGTKEYRSLIQHIPESTNPFKVSVTLYIEHRVQISLISLVPMSLLSSS